MAYVKNRITAPCIFCSRPMTFFINKGRYTIAPICKQCRRAITAELGSDWEQSSWWEEIKQEYHIERRQTWESDSREVSFEDLEGFYDHASKSEQSDRYFTVEGGQRPTADIHGKLAIVFDNTIENIIRRLYVSYGIGSRKIHAILRDTYKVNISRRKVAYLLAEFKEAGLLPDEDALFWRTWFQTLERYEKEYGLKTANESISEETD